VEGNREVDFDAVPLIGVLRRAFDFFAAEVGNQNFGVVDSPLRYWGGSPRLTGFARLKPQGGLDQARRPAESDLIGTYASEHP